MRGYLTTKTLRVYEVTYTDNEGVSQVTRFAGEGNMRLLDAINSLNPSLGEITKMRELFEVSLAEYLPKVF